MPHRVLLAGGGTGGHVYPALAMGDALIARGHTVVYFGEQSRLEGRVAPQRGYAFTAVEAVAFPRAGTWAKLKFAVTLMRTVWKARAQVKAAQASLVLGVGGYVMAPTVLGAWLAGVPCVIHEANVTPGLANRLCARVSTLVLLTYAESKGRVPGGAEQVVVGCPVNAKVLNGSRTEAAKKYGLSSDKPTLLVVGGSLGAATINTVAIAAAKGFDTGLQVLHITGPRYIDEVRQAFVSALSDLPPNVHLRDYEDRMGDAYAMADLVLCRSGSSTLAEVCALGKPTVLIPSPNVTDNHQEGNARSLERAGAAVVYVETGLDPNAAVQDIQRLLTDPQRLSTMASAARSLGKLNVAEHVAQLIDERF